MKLPSITVDWEGIKKDMLLGACLVMIISLVLSVWLFCMGFHNFDLGHNAERLNVEFKYATNRTLIDVGISGSSIVLMTPAQMVTTGVRQMQQALISCVVNALLLGVFLTMLRYSGSE